MNYDSVTINLNFPAKPDTIQFWIELVKAVDSNREALSSTQRTESAPADSPPVSVDTIIHKSLKIASTGWKAPTPVQPAYPYHLRTLAVDQQTKLAQAIQIMELSVKAKSGDNVPSDIFEIMRPGYVFKINVVFLNFSSSVYDPQFGADCY